MQRTRLFRALDGPSVSCWLKGQAAAVRSLTSYTWNAPHQGQYPRTKIAPQYILTSFWPSIWHIFWHTNLMYPTLSLVVSTPSAFCLAICSDSLASFRHLPYSPEKSTCKQNTHTTSNSAEKNGLATPGISPALLRLRNWSFCSFYIACLQITQGTEPSWTVLAWTPLVVRWFSAWTLAVLIQKITSIDVIVRCWPGSCQMSHCHTANITAMSSAPFSAWGKLGNRDISNQNTIYKISHPVGLLMYSSGHVSHSHKSIL